MATTSMTSLTLTNGMTIDQIGFGVFQIPPTETVAPVRAAIEAGYRLIDTAQGYGNEEGVGQAVRESGVPRDELFITTKLTNSEHGRDKTLRAFDASMDKLGLDVLDLFLIHWPLPMYDQYVETWKAFEELHASGRVRAIGVSNFTKETLQRLFDETDTVPVLNQIELHPRFPQAELREFHAQHGIVTEAWSPIGQGKGLLDEPVLAEIAQAHGKTPAQVVLRWHVQLGIVAIPKSVNPERIAQNIQVFDFELSDDDMARIATLDTGERMGPDPATASFR
ncbi:diketogulonate reductase-like aldo/keto reductase [Motilibacter peucedani]|uniref:Diketogulonate reductase-like aldo/keto reductase n=1 Tax=Motilibacter peucedani TaxID=598650 RepID=A0A420XTN4_9ACTN|nr:aldo/keto reductase [Motilibacter peucedani]RKS80222.1 diketogulonate reductase-like aldo/keto reductase [Motilibacter peucedani]